MPESVPYKFTVQSAWSSHIQFLPSSAPLVSCSGTLAIRGRMHNRNSISRYLLADVRVWPVTNFQKL